MQEATAPATPYGRGLWSRWPVNGWVRGGYTIAPLANHKLETSPESLLTAIIKVWAGFTGITHLNPQPQCSLDKGAMKLLGTACDAMAVHGLGQPPSFATEPQDVYALIDPQLQVDLGGACGEKSWFRPLADLVGVREAFLDRILMTVILVSNGTAWLRLHCSNSWAVLAPVSGDLLWCSMLGSRMQSLFAPWSGFSAILFGDVLM